MAELQAMLKSMSSAELRETLLENQKLTKAGKMPMQKALLVTRLVKEEILSRMV